MWIYKLTNTMNGKIYVGKTVDLKARLYMHARAYDHARSSLHRAIRKHGFPAFSVDVLESGIVEEATLNRLERQWIAALNATDRSAGYNLTSGGEGTLGYRPSDSVRARWSEQRKGKKPSASTRAATSRRFKGVPKPIEQREKIAAAASGRQLSPASRAKIAAARTKLIEYGGEALSVTQLAELSGVSVDALRWRLRQGWPMERALACGWGGAA